MYKMNYAKNIKYDSSKEDLSKRSIKKSLILTHKYCLAAVIEYSPMQLVQIYFNSATYDEVEKDVKVTLEAQLGLIGGTMGLLTGFSILSGVEIVYYFFMFLMRLVNTSKADREARKK